jgi:hypothetical protein
MAQTFFLSTFLPTFIQRSFELLGALVLGKLLTRYFQLVIIYNNTGYNVRDIMYGIQPLARGNPTIFNAHFHSIGIHYSC